MDLPPEVQDLVVAFLLLQNTLTDQGQALLSLRSCSKSMHDFGAAACQPEALQQVLVESSAMRLHSRVPGRLWRTPMFDQVLGVQRHREAHASRAGKRSSARLQGWPAKDPAQFRLVRQLSEETQAAACRLSSKADALRKLHPACWSADSWAMMRACLDMTFEMVQDMDKWCDM